MLNVDDALVDRLALFVELKALGVDIVALLAVRSDARAELEELRQRQQIARAAVLEQIEQLRALLTSHDETVH
jgi:hypothetical protein